MSQVICTGACRCRGYTVSVNIVDAVIERGFDASEGCDASVWLSEAGVDTHGGLIECHWDAPILCDARIYELIPHALRLVGD